MAWVTGVGSHNPEESLAQMVGHRNQISEWPQLACPCALGQLLRVSAGVLDTFGDSH